MDDKLAVSEITQSNDKLTVLVKTCEDIEMNELNRKKLVQNLQNLERSFIELIPYCQNILTKIHARTVSFFKQSVANKKNPYSGIKKVAFYSNDVSIKTNTSAELSANHNEIIRKNLKAFVDGYNYVLSEPDDGKREALKTNLRVVFNEINWSQQIRTIISADLSKALSSYDRLRKKLNRLINENSDTRINRFEFLTFLDNFESYPFEDSVKNHILSQVQSEIKSIDSILGISILDETSIVTDILTKFNDYVNMKNAVLLSIKRYVASVCLQNGIKCKEKVDEIINSAIIEVSSALYRYNTEKDFIPFVHNWCVSSISKHRVNERIVRAPFQIEQRKSLIFQAYREVVEEDLGENKSHEITNRTIDLISNKISEIDPESIIDKEDLSAYLKSHNIVDIDSVNESEQTGANNDTFLVSPEEQVDLMMRRKRLDYEIKQLNQIDQTILRAQLSANHEGMGISNISEMIGLTYHQSRRKIENIANVIKGMQEKISREDHCQ